METANRKEIASLLEDLGQTCDTGFAFALHIRFTRPNILYRTYPEPWIDEYSEKGMMMDDPVVLWGLQHVGIVRWEDLDDPKGVLKGAKSHGLYNGLTCAVLENGSRSISGFTRSSAPFSEDEAQDLLEKTRRLHNLTAGLSDL
ncbi:MULTISPECIES: autoinducer binding domain-containing protein [unclassified Thioclava]|uniref:autoinducer binding domain-containing protein n=1 Tax=unclassified Thioclava TaxID=2621713 RepID=UPI00099692C0|nr:MULTISPECIES: autoinducer binding domain-containing protein [unclassified Thioclava]